MRERAMRLAGPLALLAIGAGLLFWTWGCWPDPIVDFGRELYVPWRIARGAVLYRDLVWFNGPLSPYWNALWFALFGEGLRVLVVVNVVQAAALVAALYALVARIADRLAATVACAMALGLFCFGRYELIGNSNWITPYSHEMTHGLLLSLASLLLVGSHLRRPGRAKLAAAGLLWGCVFLGKPEMFAALTAALVAAAAALVFARAAGPAELAALALPALLPPLAAFVLLGAAMPLPDALRAVAGAWPYVADPGVRGLAFFREGMGIDDPARTLRQWRASTTAWLVALTPLAAAALAPRVRPLAPGARARAPWMAFALASAGLAFAAPWIAWQRLARPLPLLLLLAVGVQLAALARVRRERLAPEPIVSRLVFAVFALALTGKILLHVRVSHYGFALAVPGTAVLVAALLSWIPAWIDRCGGSGAVFRGGALALLLAFSLGHLAASARHYEAIRNPVARGRDAFLADHRGAVLRPLLADLANRIRPHETLLVLPSGVMLNYLLRRAAPEPFFSAQAADVTLFGERRVVAALRDDPPDWIAVVYKGRDKREALDLLRYAPTLLRFVNRHYRAAFELRGRSRPRPFGVLVVERADRATGAPSPMRDAPPYLR